MWRDIVINVHPYSCKVSIIPVGFQLNFIFSTGFLQIIKKISHFTKIRLVGNVLFHAGGRAGGRTDRRTEAILRRHLKIPRSAHTVYICVFLVCISEQTTIISLCSIDWFLSITETECVYCAVRTESVNKQIAFRPDSVKDGITFFDWRQWTLRSYFYYRNVTQCRGHAAGSAVGWDTALRVGRSQVRFPMVSLKFFIDITLPAALWPWGWLSL